MTSDSHSLSVAVRGKLPADRPHLGLAAFPSVAGSLVRPGEESKDYWALASLGKSVLN